LFWLGEAKVLGTIKPIYTVSEQLMDEVDPTLLDLVKTTVNSFTKWDLARFYSENPHVIVTAETVSCQTAQV
jgi:hypothetical protein